MSERTLERMNEKKKKNTEAVKKKKLYERMEEQQRQPQNTRNQHKTWKCMSKKFICFFSLSFRRRFQLIYLWVFCVTRRRAAMGIIYMLDVGGSGRWIQSSTVTRIRRLKCETRGHRRMWLLGAERSTPHALQSATMRLRRPREKCNEIYILLIEWHGYCVDESRPKAKTIAIHCAAGERL